MSENTLDSIYEVYIPLYHAIYVFGDTEAEIEMDDYIFNENFVRFEIFSDQDNLSFVITDPEKKIITSGTLCRTQNQTSSVLSPGQKPNTLNPFEMEVTSTLEEAYIRQMENLVPLSTQTPALRLQLPPLVWLWMGVITITSFIILMR